MEKKIRFIGCPIYTGPELIGNDFTRYIGLDDDYEDYKARIAFLKLVIEKAKSTLTDDTKDILTIFVIPEFFFRGKNGAYPLDVITGKIDAKTNTVLDQGLIASLRDLVKDKNWENWLFVFGSIIANGYTSDSGKNVVFNYTLIQKGGFDKIEDAIENSRIVMKENLSGIDFLDPIKNKAIDPSTLTEDKVEYLDSWNIILADGTINDATASYYCQIMQNANDITNDAGAKIKNICTARGLKTKPDKATRGTIENDKTIKPLIQINDKIALARGLTYYSAKKTSFINSITAGNKAKSKTTLQKYVVRRARDRADKMVRDDIMNRVWDNVFADVGGTKVTKGMVTYFKSRNTSYDPLGLVEIDGIKFAIEICLDHLCSNAKKTIAVYNNEIPSNYPLLAEYMYSGEERYLLSSVKNGADVHIVISCGMSINHNSIVAKEGGWVFNCDGLNGVHKSDMTDRAGYSNADYGNGFYAHTGLLSVCDLDLGLEEPSLPSALVLKDNKDGTFTATKPKMTQITMPLHPAPDNKADIQYNTSSKAVYFSEIFYNPLITYGDIKNPISNQSNAFDIYINKYDPLTVTI
jgi:hypothetical protein